VEFRVMTVAPLYRASLPVRERGAPTDGAARFADLVKAAAADAGRHAHVNGPPVPRQLPRVTKEQNLAVQIGQNDRNAAKFTKLLELTRTQPESALLKVLAPICKEFNERKALIDARNIQTEPDHINTDKHFKHQRFFADRQTRLFNSLSDEVEAALSRYPNSSFAPKVRKIINS
jgi:hypothetical protein